MQHQPCRCLIPIPIFAIFLTIGLMILLAPQPVRAQTPLTLQQAVEIALEKNPTRKVALANQRVAAAGIRKARSDLWPQLTFTESFTRGNDPVYVFGTKLRQRRFTLTDFELARLNTPTPLNNFNTRLGATWNLFDFRESWLGVARAQRLHAAADRQLERAEQELVFRVVEAYFALLLAQKNQQVAQDAVRTAQAILEYSRARFEAGLVVQSDVLSAQVHAASRRQELIRARNDVKVAAARLNHELGVPAESRFDPAEVLAERDLPTTSLEEVVARALEQRPDLQGIKQREAAQEKGVAMAKAAFGPRVDLFAGWEADNAAFLSNGGTHWLGGVEVEFDLFQGGAKRARLARERALRDRMAALRATATSGVQLEARSAYFDLEAARQQVEVVRAAVAQARESLRIIQDRYQAGLTTITDLLRAEDATNRTQTQYWETVYRLHTSHANLELATGTLNAGSPVVTP